MGSFRRRFTIAFGINSEDDAVEDELRRENDFYKRDVLKASSKLKGTNLSVDEKIKFLRQIGSRSWTGGSGISKYASKYLLEHFGILEGTVQPPQLKIALLQCIVEISWLNEDIKTNFVEKNLLEYMSKILDEDGDDINVKRWVVYTLLCFATGSYTMQTAILKLDNLGPKLRRLSHEIWPEWTYNEALKLIELLGIPDDDDSSNNDDDTTADFW